MKRLVYSLTLLLLAVVAVMPLAAQQDAPSAQEGEIIVPDGWTVLPAAEYDEYFSEIENFDASVATEGVLTVVIMLPAQIEALLGADALRQDPAELLVALFNILYEDDIPADAFHSDPVVGMESQTYYYSFGDEELSVGEAYLLTGADGEPYFVDIYGPDGTVRPAREQLDFILDGLDPSTDAPPPTDELEPGLPVAIPDGWLLLPAIRHSSYYGELVGFEGKVVGDADITVLIVTPAQIESFLEDTGVPEDPTELMIAMYERIYNFTIDLEAIEDGKMDGQPAKFWPFNYGEETDNSGTGEVYVVPAPDGGQFFVEVYGAVPAMEDSREAIDMVLDSVAALVAPPDAE